MFTVLDAAELSALASEFDLGSVRVSRTIAAGTINSNFALETDRGRFFLRVNEGKSEDDVAWESRLVSALAARGVTTPEPIAARDGRLHAPLHRASATKWVSAFEWRPGSHLATDAVTVHHARAFGAALAQLHVAALTLPADWRRSSIYDHAHLVTRFARIQGDSDSQLEPALAILREELSAAAAAAPIRAAATHGIIHGDLFRDNVLWDGDAIDSAPPSAALRGPALAVSAILDFEQASGGSLAYDLAVCINDWCWSERDRAPRLDLAAALLAGYQDTRPLAPADREALPVELRASAMRFTITRITDVYLAKVSNPEKDFRAFLARCEAWRTLSPHVVTSLFEAG